MLVAIQKHNLRNKLRKLLCYISILSLVFSMTGITYAADSSKAKIKQIAAGYQHTVILKEDGTVWTWGANSNGQLGDGTTTNRREPVQVTEIEDVIQVAAKGNHTVALKSDGTVWSWGYNLYGQLGNGSATVIGEKVPVQAVDLDHVIQIASGNNHTVALKSDGTVYAWGHNINGQLGDGTNANRHKPTQVKGLTDIIEIAAGHEHTVALKSDGTVYIWGDNYYGQLGNGTYEDKNEPILVAGLSGVSKVAAGHEHTVALKSDGTVYAWGYNENGELGDGTTDNKLAPTQVAGLSGVIQVAVGEYHTVALKSDGTVYGWGRNGYGMLGDGSRAPKSQPVQPIGLGPGEVSQIAAGGWHTVVLKTDGTVWSWGENVYGQLGDDNEGGVTVPVQSVINTAAIALIPDTTDNDVEHDIEITFSPNRTFEKHISKVTVDGVELIRDIDYTVASGKLIIYKPVSTTAGDVEIIVSAKHFPDSRVIQPIKAGTAYEMILVQDITSPLANRQPFATQPVIHLVDKYGNLCTNDNTTQITVSKNDSGDWTLEGTTVLAAKNGIVSFTDLRAINNKKVAGAQLKFSADGLNDVFSQVVTLPEELGANVPQINLIEEGNKRVKIGWRGVAEADSYEVYVSTIPQSYTTSAAVTIDTSYEISGLENGKTYYFVVRALTAGGPSDYSNEVSAVPATVPMPPTNVSAAAYDRQASVSFDPPADNGGSPVIKYIVTSYPDHIVAEGIKSPVIVSGLTNGTSYTFTVRAVNKIGASNESGHSNAVIPQGYSGGNAGGGSTGGSSSNADTRSKSVKTLAINVIIQVNGKSAQEIGTASPKTDKGNTIAQLNLDEVKIKEWIEKEGEQSVVTFIFDKDSDSKEIEHILSSLSGEIAEYLKNKKVVLEFKMPSATYRLPAVQLGLKDKNAKVTVKLDKVSSRKDLIAGPVELTLSYSNGSNETELSQYDGYVEVLIPLPDDIDTSKVITGVRLDKDGSLTHVPTKIITQNDKKYARVKTRLGGTYGVISEEKFFNDMQGHWAEDIVNELASRLIIDSTKGKYFEPNRKITRQEFAVMITKALGLMQKGAGKDYFSDITSMNSYYDAITIAYENGIITGYPDGSFGPIKEITREEAMTMMIRAMEVAGMDVSLDEEEIHHILADYPDSSSISPWAREGVAICIQLGIVEGRNDKTIAAKDSISMAETAAIVKRLLKALDLI